MYFIVAFTMNQVCAALIWVLLGVHSNKNYGVPESLYGFIPMTNALMVVFLQYPVTQVTKRHSPLLMLAAGSLFYAAGVGSVALGSGFRDFWLSMVILTFGELTLVPTASKFVADLAPVDMRGRYMSLYWLAWGLSRATAPLIGGALNDNVGPRAIWVGGFAIGLASVLGLMLLNSLGWYGKPAVLAPEAEA